MSVSHDEASGADCSTCDTLRRSPMCMLGSSAREAQHMIFVCRYSLKVGFRRSGLRQILVVTRVGRPNHDGKAENDQQPEAC